MAVTFNRHAVHAFRLAHAARCMALTVVRRNTLLRCSEECYDVVQQAFKARSCSESSSNGQDGSRLAHVFAVDVANANDAFKSL